MGRGSCKVLHFCCCKLCKHHTPVPTAVVSVFCLVKTRASGPNARCPRHSTRALGRNWATQRLATRKEHTCTITTGGKYAHVATAHVARERVLDRTGERERHEKAVGENMNSKTRVQSAQRGQRDGGNQPVALGRSCFARNPPLLPHRCAHDNSGTRGGRKRNKGVGLGG